MQPTGMRVSLPRFAATPRDAVEDLLELQEEPFPDVAKLQPTEVVIGVRAASVAFVDLIMSTGQYQHMATPPYTPGVEFAGEVLWVGAAVRDFRPGDPVIADYMAVGPRSKGGYQRSGGWASFAIVPETALFRAPTGFSFAESCVFFTGYETAYFALVKRAQLQAGETVLITGASGATGMAAIQLAKRLGAIVIASGRTAAKLAECARFGADHIVEISGGAQELRSQIKDLTQGRGVDVVYDTVGGAVGFAAFRSLAFCGRYVIVGWASNIAESNGRETFEPDRLPTNIMQMKGLQVMGSPMVIYSMQNPEWRNAQLNALRRMAEDGLLRPHVATQFPLTDFRAAARAKLDGAIVGNCILTIDPTP
ncbi:MAG: NADPH:quinone oxidoreductase family protein [Pseudomonadota bacterium]